MPTGPLWRRAKRRRRKRVLRVPVLPEEAELIQARATAAGLTMAAYMRNVGTSFRPRSVIDAKQVEKMRRINADLGQLGGLIKLWLTDDEMLDIYPQDQVLLAVRTALARIDDKQQDLREVIRRVLRAG